MMFSDFFRTSYDVFGPFFFSRLSLMFMTFFRTFMMFLDLFQDF
jgi:hypothetical protein